MTRDGVPRDGVTRDGVPPDSVARAAVANPMGPASRPRPLPWWASLAAAIGSGLALLLAFPPYGLWWLAPVGVALLAAAVHRRRAHSGFGLGLLAGLTLFGPLLAWTNLHTGVLPWVLLFICQACYVGLLGAAAAYASPLIDRWRWTWPAVTAVLWVAQEALRDRAPFGGFPWGRVAFSQADAPTLRFAALGGAPLVTCVVALAGGLLAAAAWRRWHGPSGAALALGAAVACAAGLAVPLAAPGGGAAPVTVAIVQGSVPRLGLDFNAQRRAVLDNHVRGTVELAQAVAAGRAKAPDVVVWPENASDVDPLLDQQAAAEISAAADAIEAPILVGAVLQGPGQGQSRNAGIVWLPGTGPRTGDMYLKRHPVPFAEYVPLRGIARMVSRDVDLVRTDFVAGTRPGVMPAGPATLGDVICFEVAYDEIVRDTVTGGADLLVVQTNNATFDEAEARQQLAMVRLRAVEHGRDALMASTVGVSAFVRVDGGVEQPTAFDTPAVTVADLDPRTTRTLATQLGYWPEMVLVGFALAVPVAAIVLRRRSGVARAPDDETDAAEAG
jgi:apolipoprotein N-acyltransferase